MLNLAPVFLALTNPPVAPPPLDFSVASVRPATPFVLDPLKAKVYQRTEEFDAPSVRPAQALALDALEATVDQRTEEFRRGSLKWAHHVRRMKESILSSNDMVDEESERYYSENLTEVRNTIVETRKSIKRQVKFYKRAADRLRGADEPIGKILLSHSSQIRDIQMGMISTMENTTDFLFLMLQQSREYNSGGISFETADRLSMHIKEYRNKMMPAEPRRPATSAFDAEFSSKWIMERYQTVRAHLGE